MRCVLAGLVATLVMVGTLTSGELAAQMGGSVGVPGLAPELLDTWELLRDPCRAAAVALVAAGVNTNSFSPLIRRMIQRGSLVTLPVLLEVVRSPTLSANPELVVQRLGERIGFDGNVLRGEVWSSEQARVALEEVEQAAQLARLQSARGERVEPGPAVAAAIFNDLASARSWRTAASLPTGSEAPSSC